MTIQSSNPLTLQPSNPLFSRVNGFLSQAIQDLKVHGEGFRDFIIREDLPGFINLAGIESPGLTAAPAIAKYVKKMLNGRSNL